MKVPQICVFEAWTDEAVNVSFKHDMFWRQSFGVVAVRQSAFILNNAGLQLW